MKIGVFAFLKLSVQPQTYSHDKGGVMNERWQTRVAEFKYVMAFWLTGSLLSGICASLIAVLFIKAAHVATEQGLFSISLLFTGSCLSFGCVIGLLFCLYLICTGRTTPEIMYLVINDLTELWPTFKTKKGG